MYDEQLLYHPTESSGNNFFHGIQQASVFVIILQYVHDRAVYAYTATGLYNASMQLKQRIVAPTL